MIRKLTKPLWKLKIPLSLRSKKTIPLPQLDSLKHITVKNWQKILQLNSSEVQGD